jgi:hypothetical protein
VDGPDFIALMEGRHPRPGRWLRREGAVVALYGRSPQALRALKENWWTDEIHTATLCALAVWREELDNIARDPRGEIVFQNQLAEYAEALCREGGGVTKTWKPGAPPVEWAAG